jgi:hypothetical protein
VTVDLDDLTEAFMDASLALNYFVDLQTGDVILVSETLGFIEAGQQRFEMELSPGRYLAVPVERALCYEDDLMLFLERVTDRELAEALERALERADPPQRVDALLAPYPAIAGAWAAFRRAQVRQRAVDWAALQGLTGSLPE